MLRISLTLLIALFLQTPAFAGGVQQRADVAAPARTASGAVDPGFLRSHDRLVSIAQLNQAQVVFFGDSITKGWDRHPGVFNSAFGRYQAANFGLGGDGTQHLLWRIENGEMSGFTPKVAVVLIGTNNSSARKNNPPEEVAAGIRKIVTAILNRSPRTNVLLLGIFPRGGSSADRHNLQVNALISRLHDGRRVHYMDLRDVYVDAQGQIRRTLMPDGLHLSEAGYRAWATAISPKVAQLARS
jgi:lysophospholipase L1-like esterase